MLNKLYNEEIMLKSEWADNNFRKNIMHAFFPVIRNISSQETD